MRKLILGLTLALALAGSAVEPAEAAPLSARAAIGVIVGGSIALYGIIAGIVYGVDQLLIHATAPPSVTFDGFVPVPASTASPPCPNGVLDSTTAAAIAFWQINCRAAIAFGLQCEPAPVVEAPNDPYVCMAPAITPGSTPTSCGFATQVSKALYPGGTVSCN